MTTPGRFLHLHELTKEPRRQSEGKPPPGVAIVAARVRVRESVDAGTTSTTTTTTTTTRTAGTTQVRTANGNDGHGGDQEEDLDDIEFDRRRTSEEWRNLALRFRHVRAFDKMDREALEKEVVQLRNAVRLQNEALATSVGPTFGSAYSQGLVSATEMPLLQTVRFSLDFDHAVYVMDEQHESRR